jgi:hypothetical protein
MRSTGESDPPISILENALISYFDQLSERTGEASPRSLLIYPGDTQAHDFEGDSFDQAAAISALMTKILGMLLPRFDACDIVYAAGNNDGPHNEIFVDGADEPSTKAWADALVNAGTE